MRKKLTALCLVALMLLALVACGDNTSSGDNSGDSSSSGTRDRFSSNSGDTADDDSNSAPDNSGTVITPDSDGEAWGEVGDIMRTAFFDFTVHSAELADTFDGYTPAEGYQLLVVDVTIENNTRYEQPMFFTDFPVNWVISMADEEMDGAYPVVEGLEEAEDYEDVSNVSDQQLLPYYDLPVSDPVTGVLLYEVPTDVSEFYLSFEESFEDEFTGDFFVVDIIL